MITKTRRIDLTASQEDEKNLRIAAKKLGTTKVSKVIFDSVKEFANQPAECYFIDRLAIQQINQNIEHGKIHIQKVVDEFQKITEQILTLSELETMFKGLGQFGGTSIIEEAIRVIASQKLFDQLKKNYPGMPINIDTILEEKDLTDLYKAAGTLANIPSVKMFSGIYWNCYLINGNVVSVSNDRVERMKESYRFLASGPQELQRLDKIKSLCQCLNSILSDPEAVSVNFFSSVNLFSTVYFDQESKRFEPSGIFVKIFHQ